MDHDSISSGHTNQRLDPFAASDTLKNNKSMKWKIFKNMVFRLSCEPGIGDCTAETLRTQSKEFLINKYSDLCELGVSVVKISSHETLKNQKYRVRSVALDFLYQLLNI
jgi:hypothetical protein